MSETTKYYDLSTDVTLGGNNPSDSLCPSQKAIKAYVDAMAGGSLTPPTADKDYLYFQAEKPGSTVSLKSPVSLNIQLEVSTDGTTWSNWGYTDSGGTRRFDTKTLTNREDYIFVRGDNTQFSNGIELYNCTHFSMAGKISAGGSIMSLLDKTVTQTSLLNVSYGFAYLFYGCTSLTTAPELTATVFSTYCYYGLFYGCTSLTNIRESSIIGTWDASHTGYFSHMFYGCTSLTTAPNLPATTLCVRCYEYMFYGCSSLTTAPTSLNAQTLNGYCYQYMFYGCTSLTTPPTMKMETLATYCCSNMFNGCTSLTSMPTLTGSSITALATYCYEYMFYDCASLTSTWQRISGTLANYCCQYMFYGCISLTTSLTINNASTLANYCYFHMYHGCTSLTSFSGLGGAGALKTACFAYMFYDCVSLRSPVPVTIGSRGTVASNCFAYMLWGCKLVNQIKVSVTNWNTTYAKEWVKGVASSGDFYNLGGATIATGTSGIPSGWTVHTS